MNQYLLNQLQELDEVHISYLQKVKHLSNEQLNKKPDPDQWSLAQVLYHIWYASDFTQSFMDKRIQEKKVVQPTGLKTAFRNILLHLALALPLKFKAPKPVNPVPPEISFAELESAFKKTAANFEQMVKGIPKELEDKEIYKHPRIGYINTSQTLAFLKAHALHHKAQIENLLKTV